MMPRTSWLQAIWSMMQQLLLRNMNAITAEEWRRVFRKITSRTMTWMHNRHTNGVHTVIYYFQTGLTIMFIRRHRLYGTDMKSCNPLKRVTAFLERKESINSWWLLRMFYQKLPRPAPAPSVTSFTSVR